MWRFAARARAACSYVPAAFSARVRSSYHMMAVRAACDTRAARVPSVARRPPYSGEMEFMSAPRTRANSSVQVDPGLSTRARAAFRSRGSQWSNHDGRSMMDVAFCSDPARSHEAASPVCWPKTATLPSALRVLGCAMGHSARLSEDSVHRHRLVTSRS